MVESAYPDAETYELTIAIVIFQPDQETVLKTIQSLRHALQFVSLKRVKVFLIDNTPVISSYDWLLETMADLSFEIINGQGNVGFGRANNIVADAVGKYHLVLNPDVEMDQEALANAIAFMEAHGDCGLLTPQAFNPDGTRQYLCKRYPTVLDLLLRGFAPRGVKQLFTARLNRYEMRDQIGDAVFWNPPIISGCFMFFRGDVFQKTGGFDPRYLLYFEDFDISLRTAKFAEIAYVPTVRIVHEGGNAARKGWWHIRQFARSALIFFSTHPLKLI
ncbi:GT2 family glycosyltransferase [Phyllobacterium ifriqiyense]|uniref:GT2 family glycosyltransferase n=1 Tax=Phyllobacterium ifriqiyense TaxID=314238 RepID=A0ABU0S2F9_9HYPH|nr:glycosyltransferase [Phyllobacterium ifriqiyense]MDQ0994919.1 GT2 family glycosyltransferase [Phyllobacterium ifriqiyense]